MSFVFYNPKTNTIERRTPIQPNTFQMPYLLNIQPQDLNYAMKNTSDVRSYPSSIPYPEQYDKENRSYNMETRKPAPRVLNYEKPSKEFLMMEDLREEDVEGVQNQYKPNRDQSNKYSQNSRTLEQRKPSPKKTTFVTPEQEAQEDFNIVRPEDKFLKYKPEDYSINERILNARFVREEQEKTRKFVLDRIASDIQTMEARAIGLEKELQTTDKETKALDAKTQQIWQEIERKKFELKANDILKKIDQAIDIDNEIEQEHRFDEFYRENEALYDEINRVLEEGGDDEEEQTVYYEETDRSRLPAKPKSSGYGGRSTSSGTRNTRKTGFSWNNKPGQYAHNSVKAKPKKMVPAIKPGNKSQSGQRPLASNQQQALFKNPKKVEDALQKAKAIVDLY